MDFSLSPEIEGLREVTQAFIAAEVLPLEADRSNYDDYENIRSDVLARVRAKAKAAGLWAPQMPKARGGLGLPVVGWAAVYEEANRSIFGPVCLNCAAPDDGNMSVLNRLLPDEAMKDKWLQPIIDGEIQSAFAMTEPASGVGLGSRRHDADASGAKGRALCRPWPQMVHLRGRCGNAFHPDRAHIG